MRTDAVHALWRLLTVSASPRKSDYPSLLAEMSQALAGIVVARELSDLLVGRLAELLDVNEAALLLREDEGDLVLAEMRGWPLPEGERHRLPHQGTLSTQLLQAARPLDSQDLRGATLSGASLTQDETWWLSRPEARLWIPLVRRGAYGRYILGKLQGVVLLGSRSGSEPGFGPEARRTLATLAWNAAVATENVELVAALRRRAEEAERLYSQILQSREAEGKRIARELHDGVIQDLVDFLYRLDTQAASLQAPTVEAVRQRIREIIDNLRQLCSELRPSALDDLSLVLAMRGYLEDVKESYGLDVRLVLAPGEESRMEALTEEARLCLFRVLQEGLTNVHRHARARNVEVELRADGEHVILEVRDDGQGFECPPRLGSLVHQGRFGLAGAQERVMAAGGVLEVLSHYGRGTRLLARMPREVPPGDGVKESC